jgi:hypothetical protein
MKYPSEWVHKGKGITLVWLGGHFWPTLNTDTCGPKWWNILRSEYTKVKESLWMTQHIHIKLSYIDLHCDHIRTRLCLHTNILLVTLHHHIHVGFINLIWTWQYSHSTILRVTAHSHQGRLHWSTHHLIRTSQCLHTTLLLVTLYLHIHVGYIDQQCHHIRTC